VTSTQTHPATTELNQRAALRALGGGFDSLVRSIRGMGERDRQVAERLMQMWRDLPTAVLTIEPLRLTINDVTTIEVGEHAGRWLLPCFMAGVKTIALQGASTVALMSLALEISTLTATDASVQRFFHWLGADGAEGFEVVVEQSFMDGGGGLDTTRARGLLATRVATAASAEGTLVAVDDLDRAAARPELAIGLDLFVQGAQTQAFQVTPELRTSMRQQVDDAGTWAEREVAVVLAHEGLRTMVPPARVARSVLERLQQASPSLVALVDDIAGQRDAFHQSLLMELHAGGLGEALAHGVQLHSDESFVRVVSMLARFDAGGRSSFARGWVARMASAADAPLLLARIKQLGAARLVDWLEVSQVPDRTLDALTRMAAEGADDTVVRNLLRKLPTNRWAMVLGALEGPRLVAFADEVKQTLVGGQPPDRFVDNVTRGAPALALAALESGLGASWSPKATTAVIRQAATDPQGRALLVSVARSRRASESTRLMALGALADHAEMQAAAQWRITEWLDPPAIRIRLTSYRKRQRAAVQRGK
jgi:hypothetical protein